MREAPPRPGGASSGSGQGSIGDAEAAQLFPRQQANNSNNNNNHDDIYSAVIIAEPLIIIVTSNSLRCSLSSALSLDLFL